MNQPAHWKKNDLTDAFDAIANRNRAGGTAIGARISSPTHHNQMEVPGLDVELAKLPAPVPETLPDITEEEHARRLAEFDGTVPPTPTTIAAVQGVRYSPPNPVQFSLDTVDLSDLRSIDFKSRSLIVGGLYIPLDEYSYEQLATAASNALQRSITNVAQKALKRLLPVVNETMPEVSDTKTENRILQTPREEG